MAVSLNIKKMNVCAVTLMMISSTVFAIPAHGLGLNNEANLTDNNQQVSTNEIGVALADSADILTASDQVVSSTDGDSAIKAVTAGIVVDVPKDADDGVKLAQEGKPAISISLPNESVAANAKSIAPGVVAYAGDNGSANAVQALEDGSVRMLTVIDNQNAPTEYSYKVSVPSGGSVLVVDDGSAVILDNAKQVISIVDKPWAKDADGKNLDTYFTSNGTHLTQHINHRVDGVSYPVTADPRVSWSWHGVTLYLSRWETNLVAWSTGAAGAYFGWTGFGGLIAYAAGPAAQLATSRGYCLAIYKSRFHYAGLATWPYRC
jgi:hypothetical protein